MPSRSRAGTSGSDSSARTTARCACDSPPPGNRSRLPPEKPRSRSTQPSAIARHDFLQRSVGGSQALAGQVIQRPKRGRVLRIGLGLTVGDVEEPSHIFMTPYALLNHLERSAALGRVVGFVDLVQQ